MLNAHSAGRHPAHGGVSPRRRRWAGAALVALAAAAWPLLPVYREAWAELPVSGPHAAPDWSLLPASLLLAVDLAILLVGVAQLAMLVLAGATLAARPCRGLQATVLRSAAAAGTAAALLLALALASDGPLSAATLPYLAALLACSGAGAVLLLATRRPRAGGHAAGVLTVHGHHR